MDRPVATLVQEHRIIQQVLACLDKLTQQAEIGGTLDVDSARDAVDFFRRFADGCHHVKEEELLVPIMNAKGFSFQNGPLADMRREHQLGRDLLMEVENAVDEVARNEYDALTRFMQCSRQYLAVLHEHIDKEERCLFPLVEQVLSDGDQRTLAYSFNKLENEAAALDAHEQSLEIANYLADRFEVPRQSRASPVTAVGGPMVSASD